VKSLKRLKGSASNKTLEASKLGKLGIKLYSSFETF
jgi:hypothetical protein